MPINPNIALGVQPIQQPNLLGQMGQVMALKAAQQETEGYEGVKNALSGGMSPTDPRILQYGKRGIEAYRAAGEGRVKQIEIAKKQNEVLGSIFGGVLQDPSTGPQAVTRLVEMGVMTPDQAQRVIDQAGNNPDAWRKLAKPYYEGAIDAEKRLTAETSVRTAQISSGPGYQQAALAREKFEYEKANPALQMAQGENGFYLYNPRDPNSAVPLGMRQQVPAAQPQMPPAANSLLMTTQPQTSVAPIANGLINQPINQTAGPTVANAAAMDAQANIIRPKQPVRQPVAVIKDGQVVLVKPEEAVGMTPATPGAEKALEKKTIAQEGKQSVNNVLGTIYSQYESLAKTGGITDTRKSVAENISARTGSSSVGQLAGSFTGSEAQSFRDTIEQTRPLLLTAIMKATGLSATQLNSNVELQTYLRTATDPSVSIQSNVNAMNNISKMFGLGEEFKVPEIKETRTNVAVEAPPKGVSKEIADLWKYMTPEERKLWQK